MAWAQQAEHVRRVGTLIFGVENDPIYKDFVLALRSGLQQLNWIEGRNLRIDIRFGDANSSRIRADAEELVSFAPDVIVANGVAATRAVQARTKTIPIVFVNVGDPVTNSLVARFARPEGNATGVTNLFTSIPGKWLELFKEVAPRVVRVALVFDPELSSENYITPIEAAAAAFAVDVIRTPVRNAREIQRVIAEFAAEPNGALIVLPPPLVYADRELMTKLADRHRLPAIYYARQVAIEGGLMSYGPDILDLFRSAAPYVDRILRGAKVSELPVQFPTKFELIINLKTAKTLGLTIPETLLATADEVIQ
jgi:putative ABC transport system substrate-binding protein